MCVPVRFEGCLSCSIPRPTSDQGTGEYGTREPLRAVAAPLGGRLSVPTKSCRLKPRRRSDARLPPTLRGVARAAPWQPQLPLGLESCSHHPWQPQSPLGRSAPPRPQHHVRLWEAEVHTSTVAALQRFAQSCKDTFCTTARGPLHITTDTHPHHHRRPTHRLACLHLPSAPVS